MFNARPAVRELDDATRHRASEARRHCGSHGHEPDPERFVLKEPGLRFTLRAHQRPMQATLLPNGGGSERVLRYEISVAFDTGDLEEHADRLARAAA